MALSVTILIHCWQRILTIIWLQSGQWVNTCKVKIVQFSEGFVNTVPHTILEYLDVHKITLCKLGYWQNAVGYLIDFFVK